MFKAVMFNTHAFNHGYILPFSFMFNLFLSVLYNIRIFKYYLLIKIKKSNQVILCNLQKHLFNERERISTYLMREKELVLI